MNTLLLRLVAPMQSWGTQSRFTIRDTGREPSKSGVIGLLCAALGKPRDEDHLDNQDKPKLAELAALRMGVRVNREGVPQNDFHTAGGTHRNSGKYGVVKADGKSVGTVVSTRHYLADADFLVGLESDNAELLATLETALAHPHWQLFLGRKSFVPTFPVYVKDGLLRNTKLEYALQAHWTTNERGEAAERLRIVFEPEDTSGYEVRHDVPLSFAERQFTIRYVKTDWIARPNGENDGQC